MPDAQRLQPTQQVLGRHHVTDLTASADVLQAVITTLPSLFPHNMIQNLLVYIGIEYINC